MAVGLLITTRYSVYEDILRTTQHLISLLTKGNEWLWMAVGLLITTRYSVYEDILSTSQHLISLMTRSKEVLWMAVGLLITTCYGLLVLRVDGPAPPTCTQHPCYQGYQHDDED